MPREFKMELLANDGNVVNVRRSKAVGEPPLVLGISAWSAAKDALSYVNKENSDLALGDEWRGSHRVDLDAEWVVSEMNFAKIQELLTVGTPFVLVTLVSIKGSAPQDLGAKAIIARRDFVGDRRWWENRGKGDSTCSRDDPSSHRGYKATRTWNLQRDLGMTCGGEASMFLMVILCINGTSLCLVLVMWFRLCTDFV